MTECTVCNLCENPGTLVEAKEIRSVPCHVRCFSNEVFTVWRCRNCDSLHSKEVVDLPLFYEHYPFKNHRLDYHTRVAYGNRLRMLRRLGVRETDSILDFGCGKGLFVHFLRDHGFRRAQGFDTFIPEFADPSILSEQYDVVVSHDVIEHVEEPKDFLATLVGLTRENGTLVLGTPNATRIDLMNKRSLPVELSQPYHRHILSEKVLFRLAGGFGLEAIETSHRFYFDSLFPFVNTRFMWSYIAANDGMIDAAVEPVRFGLIAKSPKLLAEGLLGYFFPPPGNILVSFRKRAASAERGTDMPSQRRSHHG